MDEKNETNYEEWYKLDNAAKIFPMVSTDKNSNIFRITATLFENVVPSALQKALETALPRFPSIAVKLRRGFFWFFLDHNTAVPKVKMEVPQLYRKIKPSEENNYLFRLSYYNKRITLEMFHTLSDGYGGFEFLKSILYHYFEILGKPVKSQNMIKTAQSPYQLRELEDSYYINYEKSSLKVLEGEPAYLIPGISFIQGGSGLIYGECDSEAFKNLAKSYGATVGELIIAVYAYSLFTTNPSIINNKKPISLFIPVNLRKYYKSETLRNFSSFVKINFTTYRMTYTFEEMLESVKEQMKAQLNKEVLTPRMSGPVSAEKLWIFRIVPLFLKAPVLKFCYKFLGENITTTSISNMGNVKLPESMEELIDKIDFSTGGTYKAKINIGVGSYKGKLTICFARSIIETRIEKAFFNFFADKIPFTLYSNSWEEDNYEEIVKAVKLPRAERKRRIRERLKEKRAIERAKSEDYKRAKKADLKNEKKKLRDEQKAGKKLKRVNDIKKKAELKKQKVEMKKSAKNQSSSGKENKK